MKEKNKYFKIGLMIFLVFAAVITFFFFIYRINDIRDGFRNLLKVLSPVIIGAVVAYLLNPLVEAISSFFKRILSSIGMKHTTAKKVSKGIGITISMLLFIALITALVWMVLPGLANSVNEIYNKLPEYGDNIEKFILDFVEDKPTIKDYVQTTMEELVTTVTDFYKDEILPQIDTYISQVLTGVMATFKMILNILIGLCVAVYLLTGKDKFIGEIKKTIYAVFKLDKANVILAVTRQVDNIFGGFITGKTVDSLIIGALCFIGTSIMQTPYAALISVIIGVTNIIPFFGPWIGAVPTIILVLAVSPQKALIFGIFVIVLQQFDGNIIGPNILGDSTGLSVFWVVVAITVGGGLYGVWGMLLGVPVFAVIYFLIKTMVEFKLKKNKMPMESTAYTRIKRIDPEDVTRQEMLQVGLSRRDRRKNKIDEYEVNREIANATRLSDERKAAKAKAKEQEKQGATEKNNDFDVETFIDNTIIKAESTTGNEESDIKNN